MKLNLKWRIVQLFSRYLLLICVIASSLNLRIMRFYLSVLPRRSLTYTQTHTHATRVSADRISRAKLAFFLSNHGEITLKRFFTI